MLFTTLLILFGNLIRAPSEGGFKAVTEESVTASGSEDGESFMGPKSGCWGYGATSD